MSNIAVIGGGQWGTTLAALLCNNGHAVRLWAREPEVVEAITRQHENAVFLPGIALPPALAPTCELAHAVAQAHLLVLAVPSRWMRPTCQALAALTPAGLPFVTVTKGLEIASGKRMSEVAQEEFAGTHPVAALSGPNLAPEIARGLPAATVIASEDAALAAQAQEWFMTPRFRPYTSTDIVGVETCGAVKNVIAIATGIAEGAGFGDNATAALMTRAVAEIGRLVQALGGRADTVAGLSGIGDLIATCASPLSRNHRVGLAVGHGEDYRTALGDSGQVAEGVPTTEAVVRLARQLGVEMPICEQVAAMLFDHRSVEEATRALMTRGRRSEA